MAPAYRWLLKWSRTLHIFLPLLALLLVLFFALTGFMLNHEDWFGLYDARTKTAEGAMPSVLLAEPDKLLIVERLRAEYGATGVMDSFDIEEDSLKVVFKGPGRLTEASISRATGHTDLLYQSCGLLGQLSDLHRGKGSGPAWSLVIDSVCVLLLLISTTGLVLWLSLQTRRRLGLAGLLLGATVFLAVYFLFVP